MRLICPSSLLERRPDVAQAERELASQMAQIGVAKAAFFPSVRLTASGGLLSGDLANLFEWESRTWSLAPTINVPIFEGGRNKANLERARAAYEESVAQYRQRVLVAFKEVEDSLAGLRYLDDEAKARRQAAEAATRATRLSAERYRAGSINFLEVVDSENVRLVNELAHIRAVNDQRIATVRLIKALGGGWNDMKLRTSNSELRTDAAGFIPKAVAAAALAAVLTLALTGCGGKSNADAPPPEPVMEVVIEKPAVAPVEDILSAVGTIEANERVVIKPETPGLIESINFTEGQRVKKGERLFELDSRREIATAAQAEAEEKLAQASIARARTLAGTKAISLQELDQLESQVAVKAATRQVEQVQLSKRAIAAPFDGVLGPRLVSPGQYVMTGTSLVTLVNDTQVKVRFRIPERQLALVRLGQEGRLRIAAYPDRVFTGAIDLISPEVDEATRTVELRLIAPNPNALLKPGMFAKVELIAGTRPQAVVIPEGGLGGVAGPFFHLCRPGRPRAVKAGQAGSAAARQSRSARGTVPRPADCRDRHPEASGRDEDRRRQSPAPSTQARNKFNSQILILEL